MTTPINRIEDERWAAHLREHAMLDEARKLQAAENLRRFDSLNHEAARLISMQATYTPREVEDAHYREHAAQLLTLTNKQIEIAGLIAQNNISLTGQMASNASEIGRMAASVTWLVRLIIGAVILGLIAYGFQRLGR